ncbi:hypothetical protein SY83_17445 [Paenibacillus swuensis]|uniref:Uncharacterized protein n=1 Tax=Paenibacillus swuensis TaxID=1178515 RepID=A0A172TL59_9BACL|nr:hypothetical protein [Paenibacillus swuensis]ANE47771.1 hypothetical protein SY83_17445 [Paenibacillus swuensis]
MPGHHSEDGHTRRHEDINVENQLTVNGGEHRNGRKSQIKNSNIGGEDKYPNAYVSSSEHQE